MRFTYAEAMTQATFYAPLAQAAEAAGYTSMTVADSLIYPQESDSKYPYTDTGDREFLDGKEFIETMVLCAHLFAVTTTLRLTPFVLKLPGRPPVLVGATMDLANERGTELIATLGRRHFSAVVDLAAVELIDTV